MKHNNIRVIGIPEGEEEQWIEKLFEKSNDGKLHQLDERKKSHKSRKQRVPSKRNPKRLTSRHIIIKIAKFQDKERILKAPREIEEVTY